jgi:hypothetical protein
MIHTQEEIEIENLSALSTDVLKEILSLREEKNRVIRNQDFERAAYLRDCEKKICDNYNIFPNIIIVKNILNQRERDEKINIILNKTS